jgi:hypothetical protein
MVVGFGCAPPQQKPSADSVEAPPGSADVERGVLGFVADGDTTVIEEYTRSSRTLEGIVRPQVPGAKFGWARYRVEFGPSGGAERAVLELGRRGDESAAVRTWTATLRGGQVVEASTAGTTTRVPAAGLVVPVFAPSMAMFNEAIRQAHRLRSSRGRAEVLIYWMASSGEMHPVTIEWRARDTVAVSYAPGRVGFYTVDTRGRVMGTRDRDGQPIVVRLR